MIENTVSKDDIERFQADFRAMREELGQVIIGQHDVVEGLLLSLVAGGNVLLEGLPGTGKTLLARSLSKVLDLSYRRIQGTPDLTPADVVGTCFILETAQGRRAFEFQKGPAFGNVVLFDHINRATPKTQSALLELMDEATVTVGTETFEVPRPHIVIATQNPLEADGAFPLPESQLDRFAFRLCMRLPTVDELDLIVSRDTEGVTRELRKIADSKRILDMQRLVRHLPIGDAVRRWSVMLVATTHPDHATAPEIAKRFVRHGAGPRGARALVLAAKTRALAQGRNRVDAEDVRSVVHAALTHRIQLTYEAQGDGIRADSVVDSVLAAIPAPAR